ncbi:uncharacterized protein (TIGR02600 family) [Roseimicrobium gellanilyticum]|uniref:Uncharacterized protein (TIGR02600 family) n=1 Tax=Roseimicrobium gellanilyticum TaxID=748857 RepID=A0A366H7L0_9BACT|nr:Verru_Chthon cassette protein A [Roseimicrobium gellanilyticum]RBP38152.1 uncharacterized protein (TIGR02600 family) [Roseimicrobium gellanilyticum]
MAIVMVLAIMALLMVLVLALLSMGSSETRSSSAFSQSSQVRTLSDMPVSIIMGQIRQATSGLGMTKSWASQPGMIRVFGTESGGPGGRSRLETAWRLYSSDKMSEEGTRFNAATEADTLSKWKETRAQFTDLNEPVAQINGEGNTRRVYPILDASALQDAAGGSKTGKVAGFGLSNTIPVPGSTSEQPLPMPVRWLYVLQDGRLVVPNGGAGDKATFDEGVVTRANPIVGRIAFWTDDESCKVNLNTAAEGTPWDVPRAAGWSDRNFAYYIPAQNEFQRFPGHPAMTCLSTVLQAFDDRYKPQLPIVQNDGTVGNKSAYQTYLKSIYDLIPRTNPGLAGEGTRGGTETPTNADGLPVKRERLFTSVDEFFYGSTFNTGTAQRAVNPSGGAVDAADLQMSRFFLTAHSRSPEVNVFNRPRVSLWPIQAETTKRTAKDKLLAFCTTAAGQTACFQRASTWENNSTKQGSSQSPTEDFALSQNQKVFGYLQTLTKKGVPGFGAATFDEKYGALNRNQILLSMFDLVRWGVNASNPYTTPKYHYIPPRAYTGLNASFLAEASAVPVVASGTSTESFGTKLKAFGRYPTIIEASVVFMATEVEMDTTTTPAQPLDKAPKDNRADKTKKMRAFLVLQPFTPVVGMPPYTPNVRYRIKGLESWKANGKPLGFPSAAVNRSWVPAGSTFDGGHSTAYTSMHAQFFKANKTAKTVAVGGSGADETNSFPFVSQEVDVSDNPNFQFTGGPITVEIHLGAGPPGQLDDKTLIQTATLNFPTPTGRWPVPRVRVDSGVDPSKDWTVSMANMDLQQRLGKNDPQNYLIVLGDTARSVVTSATSPAKGDFRVMCAMREISQDYYTKHADYDSDTKEEAQSLRHSGTSWSGHYGRGFAASYITPNTKGRQHTWQMAGYVITSPTKIDKPYGLLKDVPYWQDCQPATPYRLDGAYNAIGAGRPGDWDNGMGRIEDGPYINKPDDTGMTGNTGVRNGYFARDGFTEENSGRVYAPNRQICSAVAFGSLPTGIHPIPANSNKVSPWQTLLFCPNPPSRSRASTADPAQTDHYGFKAPRDHLMLDLFWMPVVEPYAISEPLSTAGKINMNSQIMPFAYIQRATGLHAALRSVRISALPYEIAWVKDGTTLAVTASQLEECYKSWEHWLKYDTVYEVNAEETVKGLQRRFEQGDIFRSASEICDIFLVPKPKTKTGSGDSPYYPRSDGKPSKSPSYDDMTEWWNGNLNTQKDGFELTGDNTRESPYNQLYPRLTTKSNIYQVHYRVQVLKKARSTGPAEWDEETDTISAEQRGSATIERYLDPNDPSLPDFIANPDQDGSLDDYYRFRVIGRKTFAP